MSGVEQRYAQIEKEALATTWACERYSNFLIGKTFHIKTDHKPLVSLLGPKTLDEMPPRIQRLKMRLVRFRYGISHMTGKDLITADTLSRALVVQSQQPEDKSFQDECQAYVNTVISALPVTDKRLCWKSSKRKLMMQHIKTSRNSACTGGQTKRNWV